MSTSRAPTMSAHRQTLTTSLTALTLFVFATNTTITAQNLNQGACADEKIVLEGCNATDVAACEANCGLHESTYLLDKCCKHAGINANILAFEKADAWIPRIEEYGKCTGANIRLQYVAGGEDEMGDALIEDVGENEDDKTGQGIYDAYIVQAPWLPPVYKGLKTLTEYIKENDEHIKFLDINQASRSAVSFDGLVRALPLDTDYISLGWRQDVFDNEAIKTSYNATWGEMLKVPDTIEELVVVSERLNGRHDYNNDGEMDWGFCLTPQTNYFQAFLAPVLQTHLNECEVVEGGYKCVGADTGQNMFFDVDNFEPLIYNEGFRYAVEMYSRFIMASNCQNQTADGVKCDRKTAFPTGRCAGVISMPGTMTNLLREGGKYAPKSDKRMDNVLKPGQYWGRRKVFPGSDKVINWNKEGRPLEDCAGEVCPLAKNGINYAPFFSEGGESYALNGRQSKPTATDAMWDMFTWLSTLPVGEVPLAGVYRKSQLTEEAMEHLAKAWNNTVMAQDLHDVLDEYFRSEEDGGNTVQDLFIIGFAEYNEALDTELHKNLILEDVKEGGLFNMTDPSESINPVKNKVEFEERYNRFIANLAMRYDDVHAMQDGGALNQLSLWRGALNIHPTKSKEQICQELLATDHKSFNKLECINVVVLKDLCQSQKEDVEEYAPDTCKVDNNNSTVIMAVLFAIIGAGLVGGLVYYMYKRYVNYIRIQKAHEQLMEATLNESVRALYQLDYPLHLIRGDEFVEEGKLMRHEVLRNTHKLTVLDSLPDVDAFIEAGKHVLFFSHQWTSFTSPDPSNIQYQAMCEAVKELAKRNGWNHNLKDVFVWVDYSSIPQVNPSTQNLAIRSLAAYASSATYFVIVAPDTPHADLDDMCDLGTYQRRMWCRAEQVCHSMRNGTEGMYLGTGKTSPLEPVKSDFFRESLHVFNGELTCCRLEHKGMGACDRQSLVIPLLGLYGELYRASCEMNKKGNAEALASVNAFLNEIEKHQEEVFPRTFQRVIWRKNRRVTEEVLLFGDLIDRMKARISSGVGFEIDDEKTATISTKASDTFVRHGASDFLRHGIVHGSGAQGSNHNGVQIETAVRKLDDNVL
eukprot:CAMPEP_0172534374 /NCGR_PEP_ID=MMETSP1067-20121228/6761_1 /TAXON_ID=265564 ORGANISM="Thalassiosira punctigera, Strain Tpunct2005C2" /NCGR_SAMPLE_ID=MMETSP1067 /ASSEMBLY_ACC=CAM_ASM_000444 /LENGTH=1089 /DNA_ID=CAMNT_0013319153 /DNA_START=394 /DNA_END=3663 /DNA_ORIENTATION=+